MGRVRSLAEKKTVGPPALVRIQGGTQGLKALATSILSRKNTGGAPVFK